MRRPSSHTRRITAAKDRWACLAETQAWSADAPSSQPRPAVRWRRGAPAASGARQASSCSAACPQRPEAHWRPKQTARAHAIWPAPQLPWVPAARCAPLGSTSRLIPEGADDVVAVRGLHCVLGVRQFLPPIQHAPAALALARAAASNGHAPPIYVPWPLERVAASLASTRARASRREGFAADAALHVTYADRRYHTDAWGSLRHILAYHWLQITAAMQPKCRVAAIDHPS